MVLHLGPWGKILVIGIGAGTVMLTLIVVVCFVGPGCWGYEWLHREEERERRRRRCFANLQQKSGEHLGLTDYGIPWKQGTLQQPVFTSYDTGNCDGSLIGRMTHRDSTYSSMSESTDKHSLSRMSILTEDGSCISEPDAPSVGPAVLNMTLRYLPTDNNGSGTGRLLIHIKDVRSLPPRDYAGGLEPFLLLQVIRTTWPLHRRAGPPLHQMRTRTLRHSFNPHFDQAFMLEARKSEIKEWYLKVTAYDQDKYTLGTELCELKLQLRDIKNLTTSTDPVQIRCNFTQTNREMGELLFGVSYLPTAQRLCVSVIKGTNLKYLEIVDSIGNFKPYVRVVHLIGSTCRSVKRKKTAFKYGTENPEFNETLTFDLTPSQLESATFLILLCNRDQGEKTKDRCLGKVALGCHVAGKKQRDHWYAVMQSPRRVVSLWHTLK